MMTNKEFLASVEKQIVDPLIVISQSEFIEPNTYSFLIQRGDSEDCAHFRPATELNEDVALMVARKIEVYYV